ncbi:protocadherin Fat 3-like [Gigantopelta aegis]|uniref:protocadherin Fat 3-like n=1 Tax=Gigantopelta aegis TaxID=1735272 RepID=UPI001B88CF5F|nr:protocadherin Fat 3-like [Gigantopelta aegis]
MSIGRTMYRVLIFVSIISLSIASPPYIANTLVTTNLNENDNGGKQLTCISCTHIRPITMRFVNPNGVTSVGPTSHCTNCFSVHQVSPISDYCLFYEKLSGGVEFAAARGYVIKVECTDGTNSTQAVINVNIIPNQYPVFAGSASATCLNPINVVALTTNDPVYTVTNVNDFENDVIYYNLTSIPVVDNFKIGIDGIIRVKTIPTDLCFPVITFFVKVRDSRDENPSPLVVTCPLQNYYTTPQLTNANRQTTVGEQLAVGSTVYTFTAIPSTPSLTYQLTTADPSLQGFFSVSGNNLILNQKLDAENAAMNVIRININISNGFCREVTYYLDVRVNDENDPPVLSPKDFSITLPEGSVAVVDANFGVTDPDLIDTHVYSIVSGNANGLFVIHPITGVITSTVLWDVDGGLHPGFVTLGVQVADIKAGSPTGATDSATVRITFTDIDDNPPVFNKAAFVFNIYDCTVPGIIGSVTATDADSSFGNNFVIYDPAEDANVKVFSNGQVFLKIQQSIGTSPPLTVTARGLGAVPKVTPWSSQVILSIANCTTQPLPGGGNSCSSRCKMSFSLGIAIILAILFGPTSY